MLSTKLIWYAPNFLYEEIPYKSTLCLHIRKALIDCPGLEGFSSLSVARRAGLLLTFWQLCFCFVCCLLWHHSVFIFLARLVFESDFFGRIKIRGENTNRYLCLSKKGTLVTRVRSADSNFALRVRESQYWRFFYPWAVLRRRSSCIRAYTKIYRDSLVHKSLSPI